MKTKRYCPHCGSKIKASCHPARIYCNPTCRRLATQHRRAFRRQLQKLNPDSEIIKGLI